MNLYFIRLTLNLFFLGVILNKLFDEINRKFYKIIFCFDTDKIFNNIKHFLFKIKRKIN